MTEIEQLRQDIEKLEAAQNLIADGDGNGSWLLHDNIVERKKQLAKLEAEAAAKADPWEETKQELRRHIENRVAAGLPVDRAANYKIYLEQRVAELETKLETRSAGAGAIASVKALADAQARIAELEAELARRPVVYCMKNNLTGIYGKHFGLDRIALFDIENPEVLAEWQSEPYTGEQS